MLSKWFIADFTLMWFLPSVSYHVPPQVSPLSKCLVTDSTLIWNCPRVSELMSLETSTMGEGFVALSALEWLLSSVDSHVLHQLLFSIRWFVTLGTFVQLLSSVCWRIHCSLRGNADALMPTCQRLLMHCRFQCSSEITFTFVLQFFRRADFSSLSLFRQR